MPKYKTHLAGGLITFFIIFLILQYLKIPLNYILLYITSCLTGSLFPDVDTKSKIQKILYFCLFFAVILTVFTQNWHFTALLSLIAFIPLIVNHRKLTHRIWFIIFIPLFIPILIYYYNEKLIEPAFFSYIFFVSGSISHIWLDFGFKGILRRK
ncbi:MAG: metal-dependent hydrolase [bacterium]